MPTFPPWLSGWEAPVIALALFGAAFALESTALGAAGAAASAPFCLFVSGYPILGNIAWTALLGNIIAAVLMRRRRDVAFAALTPFAAICIFLAVLALRGITLVHT